MNFRILIFFSLGEVLHFALVSKVDEMVKLLFDLKAKSLEIWLSENTSTIWGKDTLKCTKPREKTLSMLLEVIVLNLIQEYMYKIQNHSINKFKTSHSYTIL